MPLPPRRANGSPGGPDGDKPISRTGPAGSKKASQASGPKAGSGSGRRFFARFFSRNRDERPSPSPSSPLYSPAPEPVRRLRRGLLLALLLLVGLSGLTLAGVWVLRLLTPAPPIVLEHFNRTPVDVSAAVESWRSGKSKIVAANDAEMGTLELERSIPVALTQVPLLTSAVFQAAGEDLSCFEGGLLEPLLAAVDHHPDLLTRSDLLERHCEQLKDALFTYPAHRTLMGFAAGDGLWLPLYDTDSLLAAWMNLIPFGEHDFGVEAAAQTWFGRSVSTLSVEEAAFLAARAIAPEAHGSTSALKKIREGLLQKLLQRGLLSPTDFDAANKSRMPERPQRRDAIAVLPEYVRRAVLEGLEKMPGSPELRQGVTIYTPFDPNLQKVAANSVDRVVRTWRSNRKKEAAQMSELMEKFEPVEGGPTEPDVPAGAWMSPPGDKDQPSFTFMAMEPRSGRVRVLFEACKNCTPLRHSAFSRKRQPGSSWKPFVYSTALEQGMTQIMSFPDAPFTYQVKGESWSPKNHEEKYYKQVIARRALALSLNSIAIQLIFRVKPEKVAQMAYRLGVTSRIKPVPALALGTSPVTLAELVESYAVFASGGHRTHVRFVDRITAKNGRILYAASLPNDEPVLDPRVAYVMTDMMREVTAHGTAWPARKLKFQVAGKTGTTNESKDAWFVGFSSNLVAGSWVGFEQKDEKTLGGHETGGSLALPIWIDVMQNSAKTDPPPDFPIPPGIVTEVRSPWGGQLHAEGREMAFIGSGAKPCYEVAPPYATPKDESDSQRQNRLERYSRWKHTGNPTYRCPWKPVSELDGSASVDVPEP